MKRQDQLFKARPLGRIFGLIRLIIFLPLSISLVYGVIMGTEHVLNDDTGMMTMLALSTGFVVLYATYKSAKHTKTLLSRSLVQKLEVSFERGLVTIAHRKNLISPLEIEAVSFQDFSHQMDDIKSISNNPLKADKFSYKHQLSLFDRSNKITTITCDGENWKLETLNQINRLLNNIKRGIV